MTKPVKKCVLTTEVENIRDYEIVGYEEIIYDKIIKLEEQVEIINNKLDELLGEEK